MERRSLGAAAMSASPLCWEDPGTAPAGSSAEGHRAQGFGTASTASPRENPPGLILLASSGGETPPVDRGRAMDLIYLEFCKASAEGPHSILLSGLGIAGFDGWMLDGEGSGGTVTARGSWSMAQSPDGHQGSVEALRGLSWDQRFNNLINRCRNPVNPQHFAGDTELRVQ